MLSIIAEIAFEQRMVKAELLQLVAANIPTLIYRTTEIACELNHTLYFTPPYHPELQPIEFIWAQLKNGIARAPAREMSDLGEKIAAGMAAMTSKNWINVYRHVQKYEDSYTEDAEDTELAPTAQDDKGNELDESEQTVIGNDVLYIKSL